MKKEPEHFVVEIVNAAGGRLVSRIRLQKIAYMLDQLGADSGFDFTYHHYGPYSRELDSAVLDAEAFNLLKEKFERRQSDGARYSIFEAVEPALQEFSFLNETLRNLTKELAATPITTLELAATAHWLSHFEHFQDWETEIRRRKGSKTENGRLDEAKRLLEKFGLPPATEVAAAG